MTGQEADSFERGRLEAVCRCAVLMADKKRRDLAREILKTMNIDKQRLAELRPLFRET